MNKFDYLFEAFKNRAYIRKSFLLSIFSIVSDSAVNNTKLKEVPYALFRDKENKTVYFMKDGHRVYIDHPDFSKPLFHKNELVTVDMNVHDSIKEKIETTVGILLVNLVAIQESIGSAGIDFINGAITGGTIKGLIDSTMVDNPAPGEVVPVGKASVDDCLKISKNLDYLEGMNTVFVKASSFDALTVHPEVIALRDKRLKELEEQGKLDDPTAVALMINEVVALDAEIQYRGPSKDFYINKKFIDNARKKMFIIFDMIPDYNTGKYTLLRKSLNEGWDKNNYPAYINTAISASYDRGNATGEGGAEVKIAILLTNRMLAIQTDCNTPRYENVLITKHNFNGWVGGYHMVDGSPVRISKTDYGDLSGKIVKMRAPQYCIQPDDHICKICAGDKIGSTPERLSPEAVFIFTQFMLGKMKGMHVSQLITVSMNLEDILR